MRHELYANSHDSLKWTVVCGAAVSRRAAGILQIGMVRNDRGIVPIDMVDPRADPIVSNFFTAEHQAFANGANRNIARIRALGPMKGLVIDVFDPIYQNMQQARNLYFDQVVQRLQHRDKERRDVVLIDPDSGIAEVNAGPNHVRPEHLHQVWHALRKGDVLVVYQAYQNNLVVKTNQLTIALGNNVNVVVTDFGGPNIRVAFLLAVRT